MNRPHVVAGLVAPPDYAHGVVVDGGAVLFTSGGVPLDAAGALVGAGDVEAQTVQVAANLVTVLGEAGFDVADIVKTTIYVVAGDPSALGAVWRVVVASGLAGPRIAATLLGVAALAYPGQLVEIEVVAARDGR